jgi:hypothetical protein
MNLLTRSIQKELNHFFKVIQSGDFDIHQISKSAFTQARAKLKHTAFIELNEMVVNDFYTTQPWMSWLGRRVLSVDGSTMALPESKQLRKVYNAYCFGSGEGEKTLSRISQLYDPLNDIIINASIGRYNDSEQFLGKSHFEHLQQGDVILFDRYYAAVWLFILLKHKGTDFLVRLNSDWWKAARQMLAEGKDELVVDFTVSPKHHKILDEYGIKEREVKCRLIAYTMDNGEKAVLCTSLLDQEEYEVESIIELYKKRWAIEESYKVLKCRLDLENFTGKTPRAILQDFYVKIFMSNLCSYICQEQGRLHHNKQPKKTKKHSYKINKAFALSSLKDIPIHIFLKNRIREALQAFKEIIFRAIEPIRPGRKFIRRSSAKKKSKMNYKPL